MPCANCYNLAQTGAIVNELRPGLTTIPATSQPLSQDPPHTPKIQRRPDGLPSPHYL